MLGSKIAISVVRGESACVVRVTGDVDLATARVIEPVLRRAGRRPERLLVIDLSAVTFFGAAGATLLVSAARRARLTGTVLRLVATQRRVLRPMEITDVIGAFHIHESVGAALLARPALSDQADVPETVDVATGSVVIVSPRAAQPVDGRLGSLATTPFSGIAEAHQGCVATIVRAARFGWFTEAEATLLIGAVRKLSAELTARP